MGLFRAPSQRLASSYYFHKHLWGSEMMPGTGKKFLHWRNFIHATVYVLREKKRGKKKRLCHSCYFFDLAILDLV